MLSHLALRFGLAGHTWLQRFLASGVQERGHWTVHWVLQPWMLQQRCGPGQAELPRRSPLLCLPNLRWPRGWAPGVLHQHWTLDSWGSGLSHWPRSHAAPLQQQCDVQQPPWQLCCWKRRRRLFALSALESSLLLLATLPVVSANPCASEGLTPNFSLEAPAMPSPVESC